ncbi:unnamed protein product [Schistocephalus solidus]|uniref:NR LBD domain-containing protein n=1 Tax=Schistocephalus solidus TaxID=70667 RepID=A0A183TDJ0_SCHSO|nr:unnamed protein product [Schistocephalus solidus]
MQKSVCVRECARVQAWMQINGGLLAARARTKCAYTRALVSIATTLNGALYLASIIQVFLYMCMYAFALSTCLGSSCKLIVFFYFSVSVQRELISFAWVDLFLLGLCQMFSRRIPKSSLFGSTNLNRDSAVENAESPNCPNPHIKPNVESVVQGFAKAEVNPEEFTYLRYMALFNSVALNSTEPDSAKSLERVRDIENRIQEEFSLFLQTQIPPDANLPHLRPTKAISRGLRLMGLMNGFRRMSTRDVESAFFPGLNEAASIERALENFLQLDRRGSCIAQGLGSGTLPDHLPSNKCIKLEGDENPRPSEPNVATEPAVASITAGECQSLTDVGVIQGHGSASDAKASSS